MNCELGIREKRKQFVILNEAQRSEESHILNKGMRSLGKLGMTAIVVCLILNSWFLVPAPARAADPAPTGLQQAPGFFTIFAGGAGFGANAPKEPEIIIGEILQGAMLLIGVLFGILIIYGGFLWMIARGNEETVKKAVGILQTAIIGFIVVSAAYAISDYVIGTVLSAAYH